jgi:hypothetical protein
MKIVLFFNLRNKLAFGLCFQSLQAFLYVKVEVAFVIQAMVLVNLSI